MAGLYLGSHADIYVISYDTVSNGGRDNFGWGAESRRGKVGDGDGSEGWSGWAYTCMRIPQVQLVDLLLHGLFLAGSMC